MTREPHIELYGLVLAGGQSRRMGRDKALLDNRGRTQLDVAYTLLADVTRRTYVSARRSQADDPVRSRYPLIVDRYEDLGPVAGILSAMETHSDVDWLIVACDLPNLDPITLANLVEHRDVDNPFVAYRSTHDGLPEPLCAIYRRGSGDVIRQFVADGIVCPRKMLIHSESLLLEQPNPAALDNVNTPDDLAASRAEGSR